MTYRILATFGLLSLLTSASLSAQDSPVHFNIPFAFHIGKSILPAGQYRVTPRLSEGSVLAMQCVDCRKGVMVLTNGVQSSKAWSQPVLEFQRYGDVYFVKRMWLAGSHEGREFSPSKAERELARQTPPRQPKLVAVTAH